MSASRPELLRWQFDLTWSLFEFHLAEVKPEDFLWEPSTLCWTVRQDGNGAWIPDWADTEPDPIPVPTIAWLTWHIGWWWSVTLDHARQRTPREREEITWPGDGQAAIEWLRDLRAHGRLGELRTDEERLRNRPAQVAAPQRTGVTPGMDFNSPSSIELTATG